MPTPIPRRNGGVRMSLASPTATAFPALTSGRLPRRCFEACSAFTHVSAWTLTESPKATRYLEVLQSMSLPPRTAPSATGRNDRSRVGLAPTETRRLSRHTSKNDRRLPRRSRAWYHAPSRIRGSSSTSSPREAEALPLVPI